MSYSYKEASKVNWNATDVKEGEYLGHERTKLGCLMRIADAVEGMSGSYAAIISDRDMYKERSERYFERTQRIERSNAALRGVITKMKKGRR